MARHSRRDLLRNLSLASGCVVSVSFDPIGNDVQLEGGWTINGAAATADNCAAGLLLR